MSTARAIPTGTVPTMNQRDTLTVFQNSALPNSRVWFSNPTYRSRPPNGATLLRLRRNDSKIGK